MNSTLRYRLSRRGWGVAAATSWLMVLAATVLSLQFAGIAMAQEVEETVIEEIYVTGSRIKNKNLSGSAPVTVLDAEILQATGNVSIGDILQDLTTNANGINVQANNGGNGTTRVNLRGIGSARTLVLVNGRRHVLAAQGTSWAVDLNSIPLSVIERVEVLKDGASAVYGSDAIAGVVNIITRQNLEGIELNAFVGQSGETDGDILDLSMTMGVVSDRGNMLISAGFYEQDPIFAGDRGFSRFDLDYDWELNNGTFDTGGSTATPAGTIIDRSDDPGNAAWQSVIASNPSGAYYNDPTDGWRDFNAGGTSDIGAGDFYNFQPENYLLTPQKRWNIYGTGQYALAENLHAFVEGSYINRQSEQLLASTPLFTISEEITVDANNFYNPFGRDFIDVRRRFIEAGNRQFRQDIDTFRVVAGLRGDIETGAMDGWSWEAHYNFGRTQGVDVNEGRFVRSRVIEAIGPSYVDESGIARCGTATNPGTPACVPLDLLGGVSGRPITQEQLDWISYTGVDDLVATQKSAAFNLTGPLFDMPAGTVGIAFGAEYREEEGSDTPDPITNAGDTTGNKAEKTEGGYDVVDIFAELSVPVLNNLEATAAIRYSDYSNFGDTTNGKFGLIWDVTDDLTLRGTVSEAFRAPTIPELFLGAADSFPETTDPCDTSQGPRTPSQEETCTADRLPADYADSREQLRTTVGGNAALQAEEADTWTLGFVYEPSWWEGAALTVDRWQIEIDRAIQPIGAEVILSSCYNQGLENRTFCELITRTPAGFLSNIDDRNANIGGVETDGIDLTFTYEHDIPLGSMRYALDVAYLDAYTEIQGGGRRISGLGVYDLGVFAEIKANLSIYWQRGPWGASYNMRWIDGFRECEDNDCTNPDAPSRTVDDHLQNDVQASYNFGRDGGQVSRLTLGIQNVFDAKPERVANGFLANSDSDTYDYIGRYVYVGYRQGF